MNKLLQKYKNPIFYWLLAMVGITLPFPSYSLVSQTMIALAVFWLFFYNSTREKIALLKQNRHLWLSVSAIYLLSLIGIMYTDNTGYIPKELVLKIPFLVLPTILFSTPLLQNNFRFVHKYFSYAVVVASLSALIQALYFKYFLHSDYMYYHQFSIFLRRHTTYFSLLIVLAIIFFINQIIQDKKHSVSAFLLIVFLFYMLNIISSRISFASLFASAFLLIFMSVKSRKRWAVFLLIPLSFMIISLSPNIRNRLNPTFLKADKDSELSIRTHQWKAVIETISKNGLLLGGGTEGHRDYLYQQYKKYNLKNAYSEQYNAHNQFLEFMLDEGLLGLTIFLSSIVFIFWYFYKHKNILALSIITVFVIFMLTESMLERSVGIISYAYFVGLLFAETKHTKLT